jgi:probable phosphoglycerate mutase
VVDPDLLEWNYGEYEGRTTADIRQERPDWQLFRDGCPGGESMAAISARADRVLGRLRPIDGNVLVFSSGHFLRIVGARWLALDASAGRLFYLATAALSTLGYEHNRDEPVLQLWNETRHVES